MRSNGSVKVRSIIVKAVSQSHSTRQHVVRVPCHSLTTTSSIKRHISIGGSKQVPHQRLTNSSIVKRHVIKGFNVVATWHPPHHQVASSLTTSFRPPPFSVTASRGPRRSVARKLRKIHFSRKLRKIVINQPELQKLQKKYALERSQQDLSIHTKFE